MVLRLFSKKLVFDFDDAIYMRHDNHTLTKSKTRYKKFSHTLRNCDHIIAGNQVLADQATPLNNNVDVIPSAVATRNTPIKDHALSGEKTIIGWVGTDANLQYLSLLAPTLQQLSKKHLIELHVICNKTIAMQGVDVHFITWKLETQEKEIAQFDIGVMPLPDSDHAAGKCGYKALQYMAAGIPAVVSDVGVNHEIVTHNQEGMVCDKVDDFYGALEQLINDPVLRQNMGIAARAKVESHYSIEVVGNLLASTLKKVVHPHHD